MSEKTQKTILLVEDEKLLGNLLKRRLDREGFDVILARDGDKALEFLRGGTIPDLILLDLILPKVSGMEFLNKIHTDAKLSAIESPVVVISNLGQEQDIERAQKMGVVGYFVKAQLSFEELVEQIQTFFDG